MLTYLTSKLTRWLAILGVILAAVGTAFLRGRSSGKASGTIALQKKTQKTNEKFQRIDAAKPDFDGAIGKLRNRANRK